MNGIQSFALIVLSCLIALILQVLPAWLAGAAILIIFWKWRIIRSGQGQPSRLLICGIAALLLSITLLEVSNVWQRETMFSLTCISSLMFCLDRTHPRQVMLAHGSFFGLLICMLVMRGSPFPLLLYFFMTVMIFFSLMLHHLPPSAAFSLWPLSGNILKIAAPVAAILLPIYFFFPEFHPPQNESAISGISDQLEPGRIAKLSLSDRLAFRARFLKQIPKNQAFYWRIAIMEDSYGMIWRKNRGAKEEVYTNTPMEMPIQYELINDERLGIHLPLLEHTLSVQGIGNEAKTIWWQPEQRLFHSENSIVLATASGLDRFKPKQLPTNPELKLRISSRVQKLVHDLQPLSAEQQVQRILEMFSAFHYTLEPGILNSEDPLDDFLFEKQQGFCEHFAAAFATLLQLARTPARVVTGYEGGLSIGTSNFMVIRDSDAHAWTEVYFDQRWRRIDPSTVAINRVKPKSEQLWLTALPAAWLAYSLRIIAMQVKEWIDAAENLWLLLFTGLALTIPLQIWRMQNRRQKLPAWQRQLKLLLRSCEEFGLQRQAHEGMRDFLQRVALQFPSLHENLQVVSRLYNKTIYGQVQNSAEELELKQQIQKLRALLK